MLRRRSTATAVQRAFDDSAYVAELIELAAAYKKAGSLAPQPAFLVFHGRGKRALDRLFHLAFDDSQERCRRLNLDYLRPFSAENLTRSAWRNDSGRLGEEVRALGIRIQNDTERTRLFAQRPVKFLFASIPASFISDTRMVRSRKRSIEVVCGRYHGLRTI